MATKTPFFSDEFVETVRAALTEACSDGSCITYAALASKLNMTEEDVQVLREVITHEFKGDNDGDVEIVKGPQGGLAFRGLARPERTKSADAPVDQAWVQAVEAKLEEVLATKKGVSAELLAGLMGKSDSVDVRRAVNMLPGYELAKGVGIRRRVQATEKAASTG